VKATKLYRVLSTALCNCVLLVRVITARRKFLVLLKLDSSMVVDGVVA